MPNDAYAIWQAKLNRLWRPRRRAISRRWLRESGKRESDGGERHRGRRPAGFCQEQTLVMIEQFSSRERNAFHGSYLSDKIPEAVFHGQPVKTVAYLRVSTTQQDVGSQRLAILEYARKHDFRIDDFIEATVCGQDSEKRRRLGELVFLSQIKPTIIHYRQVPSLSGPERSPTRGRRLELVRTLSISI